MLGKIFLASSISCGVVSQLIVKWRMDILMKNIILPKELYKKTLWLIQNVVFDPFVLLSFFLTFMAGIFWMATLTKLQISFAYPFTSLSYIFVILFSYLFFGEPLNVYKIVGTFIIVIGLSVASQG